MQFKTGSMGNYKKRGQGPHMRVGEFFKDFRTERGMTQVELAEKLEVTQSYIVQLEKGTYKKFPFEIVKKMHNELCTQSERNQLMQTLFADITFYMNS